MSPDTWARVINQAKRGDPRHLIELLQYDGFPEDEETRLRVVIVLMLGPWQRYREAFLQRVLAGEDAFAAGVAALSRMSIDGRPGAAWLGTAGRPAALNDYHRAAARMFCAALRWEHPEMSERDIRERVIAEFGLEDLGEATLRKIFESSKKGWV